MPFFRWHILLAFRNGTAIRTGFIKLAQQVKSDALKSAHETTQLTTLVAGTMLSAGEPGA
jgi:hypothetical protein